MPRGSPNPSRLRRATFPPSGGKGRERYWASIDGKKPGAFPLPRRSGERWLGEAETEWGSTSAAQDNSRAKPSCHAIAATRAAWKCARPVALWRGKKPNSWKADASRAVPHFTESPNGSNSLFLRNSERKTVSHFSWNCSNASATSE
ncbi:hypothetical protein EN794_047340 [Mesorhizobium sp. M00.F.Ca.ET.151.01.1.1]|nr:hypothetical protein EN794_047340 [Mesorhizobium sp. M00.F.Ca.ET.151.01.1.1]